MLGVRDSATVAPARSSIGDTVRSRWLIVGLAGGLTSLAAILAGNAANGSDPPPTTRAPAGPASKAVALSTRAQALESVLPEGSAVARVQQVQSGAADYELIDASGPAGGYEVTVYNTFSRTELDESGFKQWLVPGGVVWLGEDASSSSIYFLSSSGNGLRIAHRAADGRHASISSLEEIAQRLAPLVARSTP